MKAYRKLVGDFPHDSSMNIEPSIVGRKNDEKFSTEFLRQSSLPSPSNSEETLPSRFYPFLLFSFCLTRTQGVYNASSIRNRPQLCANELVRPGSESTSASTCHRSRPRISLVSLFSWNVHTSNFLY